MKHDLLNKLNSIKIAVELLKKDLSKEKKEKILNSLEETIKDTIELVKSHKKHT